MTNRREPNSPRLTRRLKPAANDPNLRTMQVIVPHNFCPLTNPQPYQRNKAMVAVARELCGFIWELLRTQDCYQAPSPSV